MIGLSINMKITANLGSPASLNLFDLEKVLYWMTFLMQLFPFIQAWDLL